MACDDREDADRIGKTHGPERDPGADRRRLHGPFLCVRGTGKAWHRGDERVREANLARFAAEWDKYFRGDLPVKDDADVRQASASDAGNLILFGDPPSNPLIAMVVGKLPII